MSRAKRFATQQGRAREDDAGFPDAAFEPLAELEQDHFWFRSRNRLITWALGRYFPSATKVLEIGCGTGNVLEAIQGRFPTMSLTGADTSSTALRIAGGRVAADLLELDALDISFTEEFDVTCAFDVLEHVDDDELALERLAAATRRGGGILVTVPQHPWLWGPADDYGRHRRRYTKREIDRKVERAGFELVRSTGWVCTLLPAVALSRLMERRRARYDPLREFRLSGRLNRMLEFVLDVERVAIERGLTLPFGLSRLVVANKS